jgi:uncharacterized protein with PQ loop repeat
METIGWIGSILLAFSGVPQAWTSFRYGHSRGINWAMLGLWFSGDVFLLAYVIPLGDLPLIANYTLNIAVICVIVFYKIWERK